MSTPANPLPLPPDDQAIQDSIEQYTRQQKNNRVLSWQEKGKIAMDMVIDKVYTAEMNGNEGLMPVSILTPDQQKNATVWLGNQKVKMTEIPPKYSLQARQDLETHGLPPTQANIAAWWIRSERQKQ